MFFARQHWFFFSKIYSYMFVLFDCYSWWINNQELSKNNRADDWNVWRCRQKYWIMCGDRWRQMYSKFWFILQNYHVGTSLDVVRFKYFTVSFLFFITVVRVIYSATWANRKFPKYFKFDSFYFNASN